MTFKKIVRKIHLWLGLTSGIVVFIVSITGCLWVFQKEIKDLLEPTLQVAAQDEPFISLAEARENARRVFPEREIHGTIVRHATDPMQVVFYEKEPEFYQSVFLNPYSGEVLKIENHRSGFFSFILKGHLYLWLPKEIGHEITRYGTMVFVIMLITGLILWWPKSRKSSNQRLSFLWKPSTSWRRKNFDIHSIVGFYSFLLVLIISFTGLMMAFNWIGYLTYMAWGGEKSPQFIIPDNKEIGEKSRMDELYPLLAAKYPEYDELEFHYPKSDTASIYVELSSQSGVYYNADFLFFDQYSLEEIGTASIYGKYTESGLPEKVIRTTYDMHIGAILGLPGKILAFFASLVAASLPVTGFLIWWGRTNKKEYKTHSRDSKKQKVSKPKYA